MKKKTYGSEAYFKPPEKNIMNQRPVLSATDLNNQLRHELQQQKDLTTYFQNLSIARNNLILELNKRNERQTDRLNSTQIELEKYLNEAFESGKIVEEVSRLRKLDKSINRALAFIRNLEYTSEKDKIEAQIILDELEE